MRTCKSRIIAVQFEAVVVDMTGLFNMSRTWREIRDGCRDSGTDAARAAR